MSDSLKSGSWYRLELPLEKIFIAQYLPGEEIPGDGVFRFPDGSQKQSSEIVPFLVSMIEIEPPDLSRDFNITDFFDE